jgi:hypothetical protein
MPRPPALSSKTPGPDFRECSLLGCQLDALFEPLGWHAIHGRTAARRRRSAAGGPHGRHPGGDRRAAPTPPTGAISAPSSLESGETGCRPSLRPSRCTSRTSNGKLAAIAVYHRSTDHLTPTDHDVVRAVVRGTRRQLGVAQPLENRARARRTANRGASHSRRSARVARSREYPRIAKRQRLPSTYDDDRS